MNHTQALYKCIYKNAQMGMGCSATVLSIYTDGALCTDITEQNKEYRNILIEAKNALGNKCQGCCMTEKEKLMATCMTKMKMMMNSSDSAVAKMFIQGCTCGIIDVIKCKNRLTSPDADAVALADRFIAFQSGVIERMKEFL